MKSDFDPEQLRWDPGDQILKNVPRKPAGVYKTKPGEKFLRGPIPLDWISIAAKGAGKALHVGVALWFYAGLTKSLKIFLNQSRLVEMFGVTRDSARRGLYTLEKLDLVSVTRHAGRKPIVVILLKTKRGKKTTEVEGNNDR